MTIMRVAQVSTPNGPFELVERQLPEPSRYTVRIAVEACGICHSDVAHPIGRVSRHDAAARAGARGGRPRRRDRSRRGRVEHRPARRCRMARRLLRTVRSVPARRVLRVRHGSAGHGHLARRRLRRVHDRPGYVARARARRPVRDRRRAAHVRGRDDLQRAAQQRRALGRPRRRPRARRSRAPRRAVRERRWASTPSRSRAAPTRRRSPRRSARIATSTARRRIPRRRSRPWAARASCSRRSRTRDAMSAMIGGLGVEGSLLVLGAPHDATRGTRVPADRRTSQRAGMVLGGVDRLRGHARLQRADGRAFDERSGAARQGGAKATTA